MKRLIYMVFCFSLVFAFEVRNIVQLNGGGYLEGESITVKAAIGEGISGDLESESYSVSAGVLSVTSSEEGINEFENLLPGKLHIAGVTPNPFNSQTEIAFNLPADGEVNIGIYTAEGRRLIQQTLTLEKGMHAITWQADDIPSGIYLINVSNDNEKASAKMVLVK